MTRDTRTVRDALAGCFTCNGSDAIWTAPNAQALAARHHDATGHPTWCDVHLSVRYGRDTASADQLDIEHAIGAAA